MTEPLYYDRAPEQLGRRDLKLSGFGIMVLGGLGFLGAVLAVTSVNSTNEEMFTVVGGGGILLVLAGSMVTAFGIRAKHGPAAGYPLAGRFAGGCGSVALTIGLGALLFLAAFIFLFVSCFAIVMASLSGGRLR